MRLPVTIIALLSMTSLPAVASELDAKFLIERKGKVIGYHEVDVTRTETGQRVDTTIEMKVSFGPITVFRYNHSSTEIWNDDVLISLVSKTKRNSKEMSVDAKRYDNELQIKGTNYEGPAPQGAMPSTYWNKDLTNAVAMINSQHGEVLDIIVEEIGQTKAPNGEVATQYKLTGSAELNLWYVGDRWVGSNFTIDGETLDYVLVEEDSA